MSDPSKVLLFGSFSEDETCSLLNRIPPKVQKPDEMKELPVTPQNPLPVLTFGSFSNISDKQVGSSRDVHPSAIQKGNKKLNEKSATEKLPNSLANGEAHSSNNCRHDNEVVDIINFPSLQLLEVNNKIDGKSIPEEIKLNGTRNNLAVDAHNKQIILSAMATTSSNDAPLPQQRLSEKIALVTGGASGIGESIVRMLHRHGAKVCIADIQDNLGELLCKSLDNSPNIIFCHCDVTKEDDVKNAVESTVQKFGTLDIMVNNAGVSGPPCSDIRDCELPSFEQVFDINVKGVFLGMKHAAHIMIPAKKGSIVSLSSVSSTIGAAGPHAYTGSKHAVLGLTRNVAAELGKHGIRVNCVSPYAVPTPMALAHLPEDERTEDAWTGFRNFVGSNANLQGVELTADDVANVVVFLASDDARYISGTNLMVDGGFTSSNHALRVFR